MVRAVEVHNAVFMLAAQFRCHLLIVVKVEFNGTQDVVFLDDLVQNIHVERQPLNGFEILNEFVAQRASDSVVSLQLRQAVRAEGVSTVYQNSRDTFSNVILQSAELTKIETSCFIVSNNWHLFSSLGFLHLDFENIN